MPCRNTSTGPLAVERAHRREAAGIVFGAAIEARPRLQLPFDVRGDEVGDLLPSMSSPSTFKRLDRPAAQRRGWPGRSSARTASGWCRRPEPRCERGAEIRAARRRPGSRSAGRPAARSPPRRRGCKPSSDSRGAPGARRLDPRGVLDDDRARWAGPAPELCRLGRAIAGAVHRQRRHDVLRFHVPQRDSRRAAALW